MWFKKKKVKDFVPPLMQVNSRTLITSKGSRYWYFSVPIKAVPMTFWLISPPTKREKDKEKFKM